MDLIEAVTLTRNTVPQVTQSQLGLTRFREHRSKSTYAFEWVRFRTKKRSISRCLFLARLAKAGGAYRPRLSLATRSSLHWPARQPPCPDWSHAPRARPARGPAPIGQHTRARDPAR